MEHSGYYTWHGHWLTSLIVRKKCLKQSDRLIVEQSLAFSLKVLLSHLFYTKCQPQILSQIPAPASSPSGLLPLRVTRREPRVHPRSRGKVGICPAHAFLRGILRSAHGPQLHHVQILPLAHGAAPVTGANTPLTPNGWPNSSASTATRRSPILSFGSTF